MASQCMDFCHALASHQKIFTFSLTIGSTFAFSLDTREATRKVEETKKKKLSPSQIRRNLRRKEGGVKEKVQRSERRRHIHH